MALDFEVKIDPESLRRILSAMSKYPEITEEAVADALDHIKRKFFSNLRSTQTFRPGVNPGRKFGIIGRLQGYVNRDDSGHSLDRLSIRIVSYSSLAELHEEGGSIHGQAGGMMRIPIGEALLASGRTKGGSRGFKWNPRSDRRTLFEIPDLVPIRTKAGDLVLVKEVRKRKKKRFGKVRKRFGGKQYDYQKVTRPFFIMKNTVRIKPRLNFMKTWNNMQAWSVGRIDSAVSKAVRKADALR